MDQESIYVPIVRIKQVRQSKAIYSNRLASPKDVLEMIFPLYRDIDREMFVVAGLDSKSIPNVINTVSIGTLSGTYVSAREVFKPLILSNCATFICIHNHLSQGSLTPSECDKKVTENLCKAGKILEITLIDHLIIGPDKSYYSFSHAGLLSNLQ